MWSVMIGGDVGDGGDAAEREAAILSAVTETVRLLGGEVTYASMSGITTGAVNLQEHALAQPADESDSVSPEAKMAAKMAEAGGQSTSAEQTAADKANDGATTTAAPAADAGTTAAPAEPSTTETPAG